MLAGWTFYKERLWQYFMITHTPREDRVTHTLFFGGKEASERWTTSKDQIAMKSSTNYVSEEDMKKNFTEEIKTRLQEKEAEEKVKKDRRCHTPRSRPHKATVYKATAWPFPPVHR